ncbi:MAG TPA: alpha/beta fold hydrolase [Methylomirabilota bacterium]|nr:alpha/beta fold hydrolase [Methylomirabilota bacterium]
MAMRRDVKERDECPAGDDVRRRLLADVAVEERRLELAGISTAVLEGGTGPSLVLLHGPGGNATHWMRVLPDLVASYHVVAPDLPGQGASAVPADRLDADRVIAWLGELIDRTCPSPPALVGYALGGALAARFAGLRGDRVRRLVLVDALGLVPFEPAPGFGLALRDFLAEPSERTHDLLWRQCAADLGRLRRHMGERWEPFKAYNIDRASTESVRAALTILMEQIGAPIPPADLARIGAPTTLIWGRHDLATPLGVAEAARARYGWALRVIEDCADDPPIEQPQAFLHALRSGLVASGPIEIASLDGGFVRLTREQLDPMTSRIDGPLLRPGDPGWEEAILVWNGIAARAPALVVQPISALDVAAAVEFAAAHRLLVGIKGGGHNIGGTAMAPYGLTLDMSRMRDVTVDPAARLARVGPGCRLADVDRATQEHGLATVLGFVSEVGVAGLALGGGFGYLTRRFGWTVDNLEEVEIVTADGRIRVASRAEEAELFWAVRGGGGNFGVVTGFTFRLHDVGPTVYGGLIAWPFERAGEVLEAYRALTTEAPIELAVWMMLLRAPAAPFVPDEWHGRRICAMSVCYSGDRSGVQQTLAPLRALGDPVVDLLHEQPYVELQSYLDGTEPKGRHYYWRTEYLAELTDELLSACSEAFAGFANPAAELGILHVGGALNQRDSADGAVGNRDVRYVCGVLGMWAPGESGADAFRQEVNQAWGRLRAFGTGGNYVNFQLAEDGPARTAAAYARNYDRLRRVKAAYDPGNLFRMNRNIAPAT